MPELSIHPTIRFAVIGLNHIHVYEQTTLLLQTGAELVSVYADEPDLIAKFVRFYDQVQVADSASAILEDESIHLIIIAVIPNRRASLSIAAMQHGKDVFCDKPAFTTFDQLAEARRIQAETGCIFSIYFGERLANPATVKAGELVKAGAIGRVIQTVGLGPHKLTASTRPNWFFQPEQSGGILNFLGSHQIDQFLFFTGSYQTEVVTAQVANFNHPEHPDFEDFGDVTLRSDGCTGYIRVDWFSPNGLDTWGDARLIILGTVGYIEVRKNCDLSSRAGGNHLFLVDQTGTRYLDCNDEDLPFGRQLLSDIVNRTEAAMSQEHCFLASELALRAQKQARRLRKGT
jgi:predicted dehydrogenase